MTNNDQPAPNPQPAVYAAIITLHLPEKGVSTAVSVVLSPADKVMVEGKPQLVQDCTLAELRAYAEAWETAVWETYDAITLGELAAIDDVEISINLAHEDDTIGELAEDWLTYALILPAAPPNEALADDPETAVVDPIPPELAAEPEADEPPDSHDPEVIVSPSEPVYEEKEADPDDEAALNVPVFGPQPGRIAGQKRPLHDLTWAATDVFIEEPALRAAQAHALSSPTREVAGVLVGPRPEKQPDGRYRVHISDTIIAKHTVMQGASVTYTPESWRYMNDQLLLRYPDETSIMVGWYHTHPGFGIFLSGMDLFIHQNFFTQIWHVALVLDPRARSAGFFGWDRQRSRVSRLDFQWPTWAEIW